MRRWAAALLCVGILDIGARACPPQEPFRTIYAETWAFSPAQIEEVYARGYYCAQPRIDGAFSPRADGGAQAAVVLEDGRRVEVAVPPSFVASTLSHIRRIVAGGHARHLFVLDFNHGHLWLDAALYDARYAGLAAAGRWREFYEALLVDPELAVVYHTQEMWAAWAQPREFTAYKGRLAPTDGAPRGSRHVRHLRARAHPSGAYALADGTRFDLSFQEEDWDAAGARLGFQITY
ncbi:MAG: hypothetical protein HY059_10215 [Proteobacteria bacterium]|nr:hypothetical protein [Pseudomonadota bacterium]